IFIAEINGRTTGAGNEVAVQCDIRYAGPGAKLSQLEVGFGLLPGTGGLQFLVSLVGRARALEYILSARSVDAFEAAAIGWVNRAFESEEKLKAATTELAERIAAFPKQGLAAIKSRVNVQKPTEQEIFG
ncbi:ClpP/crotonase, partial [Mollisia scopiformis]